MFLTIYWQMQATSVFVWEYLLQPEYSLQWSWGWCYEVWGGFSDDIFQHFYFTGRRKLNIAS